MAHLIDGKAIAANIRKELATQAAAIKAARGLAPGLAVVLVGEDPASQIYVRNKNRACAEAGIESTTYQLPATTSESELLGLIHQLNHEVTIHGILVQLPLPHGISATKILDAISPDKDVDGFHPCNLGRLTAGTPRFRPCTPWGVMELLAATGIDPAGRHAVVVGRSNIVGKPVALMLLQANATVTICHSRTPNLPTQVATAEILIAAVGRPRMIPGEWIKPGATVIDVGINRLPDGTLCGDVDFPSASLRAHAITPVPGGVGPMTIAMLLKNTVAGARHLLRIEAG